MTYKDYLYPIERMSEYTIERVKAIKLYRKSLYHYGRIQEADLYAHFSPVAFILDEKLLKTDDFNDALGDENIWDRLKKLGADRFYRVQYKRNETDDVVFLTLRRHLVQSYLLN